MIVKVDALAAHLEALVAEFTDVAVVGVSGGVDSAVVASISVAALGADNVYLVSMPYDEADSQTFNMRSAELAAHLRAKHTIVPIGDATDSVCSRLGSSFSEFYEQKHTLHKLTNGNTRARMRMAVLYGLAGELSYCFEKQLTEIGPVVEPVRGQPMQKRVRVMGTGNASEDLIGYDTKGGDALADFFIIGDLFKSEVFQLAQYYEVPHSIIEAPPSAGLYEGQTDAKELGFTYEELEPALEALHKALRRGIVDADLNPNLYEFMDIDKKTAKFVVARFLANAHKHRAPKVVSVRNSPLVKDILT